MKISYMKVIIIARLVSCVRRWRTGAGVRARGFQLPAAGKTGTSRDGWFAGFTSELLCVVWVGFDDNRELHLEGAKSALPIWTDFMKRAAKLRPYRDTQSFAAPRGLVSLRVCDDTGNLATPRCPRTRMETFIEGTEPTLECLRHNPPPEENVVEGRVEPTSPDGATADRAHPAGSSLRQ
jgi:penicillin-binding protein 1B